MRFENAIRLAEATDNADATSRAAAWLGRWTNQIGSSMTLEVEGNDVTGSYTSANSAGGPSVRGPLKGFVAGDRISFIVLWPRGSITAWTGQLINDEDAPTIKTLWHLVTDIPDADEPKKLWMSTLTGSDDFTR